MRRGFVLVVVAILGAASAVGTSAWSLEEETPPLLPEPLPNESATASDQATMQPYVETLAHLGVAAPMVPIPGGTLEITYAGDDGEQATSETIEVEPFWIATHEVTWDSYRLFMLSLDRPNDDARPANQQYADAVARPTPPYVPMDFGMGVDGFPAISMTQFAARQYTRWLSMQTGRFYRLPTEAEWEWACRAGDPQEQVSASLDDYSWHIGNSGRTYHQVATRKANAWGVFDMLGNVAEWTLEDYDVIGVEPDPLTGVRWPDSLYPRSVRGGSYLDPPASQTCNRRRPSKAVWKRSDPQIPRSIWYHTNARFLGFRVVRPLEAPDEETMRRAWEPDTESLREILAGQSH